MALKARFKKKELEIHSLDEKIEKSKLTLISNNDRVNAPTIMANILKDIQLQDDDNGSALKLNCYHKINELYQHSSMSMYNMMKSLIEIICFGIKAEGGSLWVLEDDVLCCKVAHGPNAQKLENLILPKNQGIVGWCAENKQSTIVYDTSKDQRFHDKEKSNTISLISCPLIYLDEVLGVIQVVNKENEHGHFCDSDKSFLEDLSTNIGLHLKTTRTLREHEKILKRMDSFTKLHKLLSSTMDLNKLLPTVLANAIKLSNAEVGSIWLVEDNGEGIECRYAYGPTRDQVTGLKLKHGVGIIGKVVESQASMMIEDCSRDENFSQAIDKKTNFITFSMIAAPLVVKGVCIGAIQIINKKSKTQLFDKEDLEILELFASSSAMYIKNASLFNAEKKAKDLSVLIQIGQEITSTLDLDAVLMTLVNLSSQVIPFDLASVSTINPVKGKAALRAISGEKEIDFDIPVHKAIQNLHDHILTSKKDLVYFSSRGNAEKDETQKEIFKYMQDEELESLWVKILSDDQGNVGVIHLESKNENLITSQKSELLSILISQTTVALRNVELYNTIPSSHFVKNLKQAFLMKLASFMDWPREQYYKLSGAILVVVLSLVFIKVPHNISSNIQIQPINHTFFSKLTGQVKSVMVKEGQLVKKGDLLIEVDVGDTLIELQNKESKRAKARVEMLKFQAENQIADYKIKESELLSLDYEIELLANKIKNSKIYSNVEGIVISEKLDDLIGMPVNYGQELVKIAGRDKLIVQFEVPEADILFVRAKQNVQFKVYGHPTTSFSGDQLISVSGEARKVIETDPNKYYMARAIVDTRNANHAILRPGMTGRGKINGDSRSLGENLFSPAYNFIIMEFLF